MKTVTIFVILLSLMACHSKTQIEVRSEKLLHDINISTLSAVAAQEFLETQPAEALSCLDHIKKVSCVSEKSELGYDPNCSFEAVTADMLMQIPPLLELLPPIHKEVLCNINRLQIQQNIFSIAYASMIRDENQKSIGNMMGFRLDSLRGVESQYEIWTWKEQLNFGLSKMKDPNYAFSLAGPRVLEQYPAFSQVSVLTTMTHELSHILDLMNGASGEHCQGVEDAQTQVITVTCESDPTSFSALSWPLKYSFTIGLDGEASEVKEYKEMYPWLSRLCFYYCKETIPVANMVEVYAELRNSGFTSSYAAMSTLEDFAEASTAFSLLPAGYEYRIVGPQGGALFDLLRQQNEKAVAAKMKWLKAFYSRKDLKLKF